MNNYTPTEIISMIPNCPFTKEEIGQLLKMKLVKGFHKSRTTEIDLDSFKKVLDWRNTIIDSHKVYYK
jgi:hypothetical protein